MWIPPSASAMLGAVPLDLRSADRQTNRPDGLSDRRADGPDPIARPLEQAEATFAARLAELERQIEAVLDRAPGPIRFMPLRRALWRALLMPARYVLLLYRQQLQAGLDPGTLAAIGR